MAWNKRWRRADSAGEGSAPGRLARTKTLAIRLSAGILKTFRDEQLHLQSTSLAYTTLLSLIPLLAVTFSVLKGFGVQQQLEPMLMQSLAPLGDQGTEIGRHILTYVGNLNFAVLGFFGIALLFWIVISLLTRVEETFNAIWRIPGVRGWSRRFSDYLSVALVGPVFIFTALGITTLVFRGENLHGLLNNELLGRLVVGLGRLVPYLLVCAAFAFLYAFLTNHRVRLVPALAGGLFAGVTWYGVGHLFAWLVAGSSKYSAIYSGLAAAVLFIIWTNVGWLIILIGAHIARYTQYPHLLRSHLRDPEAKRPRDAVLALDLMTAIGRAHYFDEPQWTLEALTAHGHPDTPSRVERILRALQQEGLAVATGDEPPAYLPARAIETIPLQKILDVAHAGGVESARYGAVQELIADIERAVAGNLEGKTLKDLVLADKPPSHALGGVLN